MEALRIPVRGRVLDDCVSDWESLHLARPRSNSNMLILRKRFCAGWRTLCRRLLGERPASQEDLAALPGDKVERRNYGNFRNRSVDRLLDRADLSIARGYQQRPMRHLLPNDSRISEK